jgi:hypothetical protein
VERRNNGRVFNGRVKMEMDSAVWVCTGLRTKRWMYEKSVLVKRLICKILLQCAVLITTLIIWKCSVNKHYRC